MKLLKKFRKLEFKYCLENLEFGNCNLKKGQATILILTMMVAVAGIVLFITRSAQTDLQMSKVQEESARAFSAAEAGIETSLFNFQVGTTDFSLETGEVTAVSSSLGAGAGSFKTTERVADGDFGIIWLTGHKDSGEIDPTVDLYSGSSLSVCWEDKAALELILFYSSSGEYKTQRWAFDPDPARRGAPPAGNGFADPSTPSPGNCTDFPDFVGAQIALPAGRLFLAAKVYYQDTFLAAQAGGSAVFPSQGKMVVSTGQVESLGEKVVSRRLQVFQSWGLPPLIFLEPLFAGENASAP